MNKFLAVTATAVALTFGQNALAETAAAPMANNMKTNTVAEATQMQDDAPVVLVGTISKALGNEKYEFQDATGTVIVEIDNDDWNGINPNSGETLMLVGEVDNEKGQPIEVDVEMISVQPQM